jgi:small subunit ribosomal protein S6
MEQKLPAHRAREYETIFIVHPDAGTEVIDRVSGRCREVVGRLSGKLLKAENWGRRRLAYPVKKQEKGIYLYLRYLGYSDMVHELERNLRMLDPVLKHMTVKIDEDVNPDARPVNEEDISFQPKFEEEEPVHMESEAAARGTHEGEEDVPAPAGEPATDEDGTEDEDDNREADGDESEE